MKIMSGYHYDDFVYHSEIDTDIIIHLDETEWIDTVKLYITRVTFMNVAHHFERRAFLFMNDYNDGTVKISFLADFLECDRSLLPMMPLRSQQWKEHVLIDLYRRVYEHPATSIPNKILAASYLLDRSCSLGEDAIQNIIDQLFRIQNQNHGEDWDVFDLLYRHMDLMRFEDHQRLLDWNIHHRRVAPRQLDEQTQLIVDETAGRRIMTPQPMILTTDSQNIHTASINHAMQRCLDIVSEIPLCDLQTFDEMEKFTIGMFHNVFPALNRIRTDPSLFHGESNRVNFRLSHVFERVFSYIYDTPDSETRATLWQRLKEELMEAQGTCCTGHLTRLINVLVGFHGDIHLTIDDSDYIKIKFCQILSRIVSRDDDGSVTDDITSDMIDPAPKGSFCRFLTRHRADFLKELCDYEHPRIDTALWELYPSLVHYHIFYRKPWWKKCHLRWVDSCFGIRH